MSKPKSGFLTVYCPTYVSSNNKIAKFWVNKDNINIDRIRNTLKN